MSVTKNYVQGFDGLRAIAIIGVTLYHLFPSDVKGGFLGVPLFFVLSGYLLAITTEKAWEKHDFSVIRFYRKRIRRIYPALFIVVMVTAGVLEIFMSDEMRGIRSELASIFCGYNNWWQIMQNSSYFDRISNASPFTHLWFLSIELQYYLIWPALYIFYKLVQRVLKKRCTICFFGTLVVVSALLMYAGYHIGEDPSRIYYGTDTRAFSILLGILLGELHTRRKDSERGKYSARIENVLFAVCIVFVVVAFLLMDGQEQITYRGGMFVVSIIFVLLIELVSNKRLPFGTWLEKKPFLWIGKRSYEIYLWQYPVIYFCDYQNFAQGGFGSLIKIGIILILSEWLYQLIKMWSRKYEVH